MSDDPPAHRGRGPSNRAATDGCVLESSVARGGVRYFEPPHLASMVAAARRSGARRPGAGRPRVLVEGAVDGGLADVGEAEVVVAGVGA